MSRIEIESFVDGYLTSRSKLRNLGCNTFDILQKFKKRKARENLDESPQYKKNLRDWRKTYEVIYLEKDRLNKSQRGLAQRKSQKKRGNESLYAETPFTVFDLYENSFMSANEQKLKSVHKQLERKAQPTELPKYQSPSCKSYTLGALAAYSKVLHLTQINPEHREVSHEKAAQPKSANKTRTHLETEHFPNTSRNTQRVSGQKQNNCQFNEITGQQTLIHPRRQKDNFLSK